MSRQTRKTFRGIATDKNTQGVGAIHVAEGGSGFVIREFADDGNGAIMFGGRVFSADEFTHVRTTNLGYATEKWYQVPADLDEMLEDFWIGL